MSTADRHNAGQRRGRPGEPRRTAATGRGVLVAVVDSGWDRNRRDPRVLPGVGMVGASDDLELEVSNDDLDRNGHGTVCAQLVLSIAPDAHVLPIRVFGRRLETSVRQLVAALHFAAERRASVINLSLATGRGDALTQLYASCEVARRCGAVVVASARQAANYSLPAAFANVIGVVATDEVDPDVLQYRREEAVEFAACGVAPEGSVAGAHRGAHGSSSLAAARVSGMVALFREEQPCGGIEDVRRWLAARAADIPR